MLTTNVYQLEQHIIETTTLTTMLDFVLNRFTFFFLICLIYNNL